MKLIGIVLAAAVALGGSWGIAKSPATDLLYGEPLHTTANGVRIDYDGKSNLLLRSETRRLALQARSPAEVDVSPTRKYLAHNFGNGSGQIYDFRVYSLRSGRALDVGPFKQRVLAFAHSKKTCRAGADQISFVVERWLSPSALQIGTEDWTRRPGCGHLYRKWTLKLS